MKRWYFIPAGLLVVAIVAGAGYLGYTSSTAAKDTVIQAPPTVPVSRGDVVLSVTAPGSAVATHQVQLSMGVSGQLGDVKVLPGAAVKKGQVLAQMSDPASFEAAVANARLQVAQAQTALDTLLATAPQVTAQAQLALVQAQKAVDDAQNARDLLNYSRGQNGNADAAWAELYLAQDAYNRALERFNQFANLDPTDPARASAQAALVAAQQVMQSKQAAVNWVTSGPSSSDVAQADANLALAKANLTMAQDKWQQVKNGPDPDQLAAAQDTLANAQAALQKAQNDLQMVTLVAPFDGVVTDVSATNGQTVSDATTILTLTDPTALEVDATVVENDYPLVSVGQSVTLYFDALPEANVTGKVARIIPKRMSGAQANYTIAISLDAIADHLVDGMSADASIVISQSSNVLRLPRSVVRARSDNTATVKVWTGTQTVSREVTVGLKGDSFTEIASGLNAGDQVVAQ